MNTPLNFETLSDASLLDASLGLLDVHADSDVSMASNCQTPFTTVVAHGSHIYFAAIPEVPSSYGDFPPVTFKEIEKPNKPSPYISKVRLLQVLRSCPLDHLCSTIEDCCKKLNIDYKFGSNQFSYDCSSYFHFKVSIGSYIHSKVTFGLEIFELPDSQYCLYLQNYSGDRFVYGNLFREFKQLLVNQKVVEQIPVPQKQF
jgi:hypothetical protein